MLSLALDRNRTEPARGSSAAHLISGSVARVVQASGCVAHFRQIEHPIGKNIDDGGATELRAIWLVPIIEVNMPVEVEGRLEPSEKAPNRAKTPVRDIASV